LHFKNIPLVVKVISESIGSFMISNNNPLLSGIIDVMNLHPDLIE
ncbi:5959_t:CDS:1, partial [Entrophospora sp. SA101]